MKFTTHSPPELFYKKLTKYAEENAAGLAAATAVMAGNRKESRATQKHATRAQEEAVIVVDAKYKKPMP